jgi:hypothetical protein
MLCLNTPAGWGYVPFSKRRRALQAPKNSLSLDTVASKYLNRSYIRASMISRRLKVLLNHHRAAEEMKLETRRKQMASDPHYQLYSLTGPNAADGTVKNPHALRVHPTQEEKELAFRTVVGGGTLRKHSPADPGTSLTRTRQMLPDLASTPLRAPLPATIATARGLASTVKEVRISATPTPTAHIMSPPQSASGPSQRTEALGTLSRKTAEITASQLEQRVQPAPSQAAVSEPMVNTDSVPVQADLAPSSPPQDSGLAPASASQIETRGLTGCPEPYEAGAGKVVPRERSNEGTVGDASGQPRSRPEHKEMPWETHNEQVQRSTQAMGQAEQPLSLDPSVASSAVHPGQEGPRMTGGLRAAEDPPATAVPSILPSTPSPSAVVAERVRHTGAPGAALGRATSLGGALTSKRENEDEGGRWSALPSGSSQPTPGGVPASARPTSPLATTARPDYTPERLAKLFSIPSTRPEAGRAKAPLKVAQAYPMPRAEEGAAGDGRVDDAGERGLATGDLRRLSIPQLPRPEVPRARVVVNGGLGATTMAFGPSLAVLVVDGAAQHGSDGLPVTAADLLKPSVPPEVKRRVLTGLQAGLFELGADSDSDEGVLRAAIRVIQVGPFSSALEL